MCVEETCIDRVEYCAELSFEDPRACAKFNEADHFTLISEECKYTKRCQLSERTEICLTVLIPPSNDE